MKTLRRSAQLLPIGLLTACGAAPAPKPAPTTPPIAEAQPPRAVASQPGFIASQRARSGGLAIGDHVGILHDRFRFEVDAAGRIVGRAENAYHLGSAFPLPESAGGGVLFGGEALLRSPTFLGQLTRVANPGSGAQSVTFGPSQALVMLDSGGVIALSLPELREVPPFPAGAIYAASAKGGVGGVIAEGGVELATSDGGKTWSKLVGPTLADSSQAKLNVVFELEGRDDGVYFFESVRTLRLDATGVVEVSAGRTNDEKKRLDRNFDEVVANGAVLETDASGTPTKAIAGLNGTIYVADLATGAVTETERGALPAQMDCRTTRLAQEIVVLCAKGESAAVFSGPIGGKIQHEKTFGVTGNFARGADDAILFTGACAGAVHKVGLACGRTPASGKTAAFWSPIDRTIELSDSRPERPTLVRAWVPAARGPVLILGGEDGGILDANGGRSHLEPEELQQLERLFEHGLRLVLDDRFTVEADGTIRGFDESGRGVEIAEGGKRVTASPFSYGASAHAGPNVLASGSGGALFLSTDWGKSFAEVASAPSDARVQRCSEVGCILTPWIRLGWGATPPKPPPDVPVEPIVSTAEATPPALPSFVCTSAGTATRGETAPDYSGTSLPGLGNATFRFQQDQSPYSTPFIRRFLGMPSGPQDANSYRAILLGLAPIVDGVYLTDKVPARFDRQLTWIEPFDPKGTRQKASLPIDSLVTRAAASGLPSPDLVTSGEEGTALPIASEAGGLLLLPTTGPPLWARGAKVTMLAGPVVVPSSVVETKPDELAVLTAGSDGQVVLRVSATSVQQLFVLSSYAPTGALPSDALAVDASGEVAVLRLPSADPPTALRPALLLRDGQAPVALAGWSELLPADAPACANKDGWRAIIPTSTPWITADFGIEPYMPSILRVRWSEQRVCLEGAEIAGPSVALATSSIDTYLAVRFGKDAGAAQLGLTLGSELRDPRRCELKK